MERTLAMDFTPTAAKNVEVSAEGLNSDLHASNKYRAHLINIMAAHAVEAALV